MTTSDFRAKARQALTGQWPVAVLVGLVASLLCGSDNWIRVNLSLEQLVRQLRFLPPEVMSLALTVAGMVGGTVAAGGLVLAVLGGVIRLGYAHYNLNLVEGKPAAIGDLFADVHRLWDAVVLRLLINLFVYLWAFALFAPAIVAGYSYSMAPYIMAEDPSCGPREAIRRSKRLMKGHKLELFVLKLSFIGWNLLSVLTLGLGNLVLRPYTNAAEAVFYLWVKDQQEKAYQATDY